MKDRIKKIGVTGTKVVAEVFVGADESNFHKAVSMTVEIRRTDPGVQAALDQLGAVVLQHADGALNRALSSRVAPVRPEQESEGVSA